MWISGLFFFYFLQLCAVFNKVSCSEMLMSLFGFNSEIPNTLQPGTIVFRKHVAPCEYTKIWKHKCICKCTQGL